MGAPAETSGRWPRADAVVVAGFAIVFTVAVVLVFALGVSGPVAPGSVAALAIAVLQVAVGLAIAAFLLSRPRTRLFGWELLLAVAVLGVTVVGVMIDGGDGGLTDAVRSPLGLLALVVLVLFDTGRPEVAVDRWVTLPAIGLATAVFVAVVIVGDPAPAAWSGVACTGACDPAGLGLVGSAGLESALQAAYAALRFVAMVACAVGLVVRLGRSRGARRPVMAAIAIPGLIYVGVGIAVGLPVVGGIDTGLAGWLVAVLLVTRLLPPLGIGTAIVIGELGYGARRDGDVDASSRRIAEMQAELERARAAMAVASQAERRRIEQDIHDGLQMQVIALRWRLDRFARPAEGSGEGHDRALTALIAEVDDLLDGVRAVGAGLRPVAPGGLAEAIQGLAGRAPVHVDVEARPIADLRPEVADAVYFCVAEALQNSVKHARDATRRWVRLAHDGEVVTFEVGDDGQPAPGRVTGSGVDGMRARMSACGGRVVVTAQAPRGVLAHGEVPVAPPASR